nr:TetR/AcrR family transcriptional regulator [uncultured Celeribacter sp.]
MTENQDSDKNRARGRPVLRTEAQTRAELLTAARAEFLESGYSGTSIGAVAQRAGVSTRTVYKVVENKDDLFRQVVQKAIDEGIESLTSPMPDPEIYGASDAAFIALARAYAELVLGLSSVRTIRAVFAEQDRFPELRESYVTSIRQVADAFDRRFAELCKAAGRSDGDGQLAELLRHVIHGKQRGAVLDPGYAPDARDISDWADLCVRTLLHLPNPEETRRSNLSAT